MSTELTESKHFADMLRRARKYPIFAAETCGQPVDWGPLALERLLPHRAPFLLLQAIARVDLAERRIVSPFAVPRHDPVFEGHFPGDPVYPGALLLETLGQLGICITHLVKTESLVLEKVDTLSHLRLIKVHHAAFLAAVRPDDNLVLIAHAIEASDFVSTCIGQVLRDREVAALAVFDILHLEA